MSEKKICLECGRKFRPNHRTIDRQKYCSERCRRKFWNLSIKSRKKLKDLNKELILEFLEDLKELIRGEMREYGSYWFEIDDIIMKWEAKLK